MTKVKLCVAYSGDSYCGYQIQNDQPTVEQTLLSAIQKVLADVLKLRASGRTDTGVHSEGQIVHFETEQIFEKNRLQYALNQILPDSIQIKHLSEVTADFDSRRSALTREYRYLFMSKKVPVYLNHRVVSIPFAPNDNFLNIFSDIFCGTHDFKCFRNTGSNEKSTVRSLYEFSISKKKYTGLYEELDDCFMYEVKLVANGFLYRMVRHLVGAVFEVLQGKADPEDLKKYFSNQACTFRYTLAPAKGLSLVKVTY